MTNVLLSAPVMRFLNGVVAGLLRRGVPMGPNTLLTVAGRKSGQPRTTPIAILAWQGERYLQSPYGETDWVRNLRAAGRGTLSRSRQQERIAVEELSAAEAAKIYQATLASFPAPVRGQFAVEPGAPLEAFVREAARHPMFRIVSPAG